MADNKVESTGSGSSMKATGGCDSGQNNGPTGSGRFYPKGKGSTQRTDWNPMKKPASTYAVGGCG